ncbi:MAG: hypothetical protein HOI23_23255 [Deltaproteobacteria bacterium]|nr:hypothetical protein [Deltaproteobacteria bacterium]
MPSEVFRDKYKDTIEVPSNWAAKSHPRRNDESIPGRGYATYVLKVLLPPGSTGSALMLTSEHQGSAARYSIIESQSGSVIGKVYQGNPGISYEEESSVWLSVTAQFHSPEQDELQIYLHLSNFRHARGGTWSVPGLGTDKDVLEKDSSYHIRSFSIFGICFIIALYHFVLYMQRREDKSTIFFGLFCAGVAIRQSCTGHFYQALGGGFGPNEFGTLLFIEYIMNPLIIISAGFFVHSLVPGQRFFRFVVIGILGFGLALVLFTCSVPSLIYSEYVVLYQIHILCASFVSLGYLSLRALQGHVIARWVLFALAALVIGGLHDILVARTILHNDYIVPYTFVFFILMQSAILSGRAARAHRQAEHLSKNLRQEVDEQTKDLRLKTVEAQEATLTAVAANAELKQVNARQLGHANNLLVQSEKLSQLGSMIAGIGHEIANPIGLISMTAENFKWTTDKLEQTVMPVFTGSVEAEEAGKKIQSLIDELRDINDATTIGSNRLKDLSMALRTQSRMDLEATPAVDINEVIHEAMVIAGGRTKVHEVLERLREVPLITCYRSRIGQVVTNLLANAADALTEKVDFVRAADGTAFLGKISVESKPAKREEVEGVLVSICDNGDGVPKSIRDNIFDQFFTTKPAGVGTGLGLSMCADIVKEHSGMLTVTDDHHLGGARFELWLPLELGSVARGDLIL